jgi:Ran GTPase-activating protein (RanGAP) involved in mRNA processing and transport
MPIDEEILQRLFDNDTTLTALTLEYNEIGDEGAKALAAALEQNTTIIQLDLGVNQIGDEGAKVLAVALEHNTTLTQLSLWDNQIGDEGAKALAAALEQNTTLTQLNLRNNPISANLKKQIERLNERNQRLLKELQAIALKQLKAGRVLLRNASAADNNTSLATLPTEVRERIVKMLDNQGLMTKRPTKVGIK